MRDFRMVALALIFTVAMEMELDMANHQAGQGQGSKGEPLAFLCAQLQPPGMPRLFLWPWWTHKQLCQATGPLALALDVAASAAAFAAASSAQRVATRSVAFCTASGVRVLRKSERPMRCVQVARHPSLAALMNPPLCRSRGDRWRARRISG
eukprot:scaffold977_cov103-Isochrysis_galbana.AAC.5